MDKLVNIMDRKLFKGSTKSIELRGVKYETGRLSTGSDALVGVYLDENDPHYHDKLNFAINNQRAISFAIDLPPEAADMWLQAYNDATIAGKSGLEAEGVAWEIINKHYYKNDSGRWLKLAENWTEEVTHQIEPIIEIVKVGKFRGSEEVEITSADIDSMITNFEAGMRSPAITNDHRQAGPSFGGVKKLFRIGERLYAQLTNLTKGFIEAVRNKQYTDRSIEFYKDYVDGSGKHFGALLDVISFLGAKTPAVKGMALPAFSENGTRYAFSLDNEKIRGRAGVFIESEGDNLDVRRKDPDLFNEFRLKVHSDKEGIRVIMGRLKSTGAWEVQAVLFAKAKNWTMEKALNWVNKNGYKISANEPSNNKKGKNNLGEVTLTQEELDAKLKAAEEAGSKKALSDSELKHKAELEAKDAETKKKDDEIAETKKKLADEQAASKKKLAEDAANKAEAEATKIFEHYSSKAGGGKLLPAQKEHYIEQFKTAILSENKEALDKLKKQVESFPNVVEFAELTRPIEKANGNPEIDGKKLNLSEEDTTELKQVALLMEKRAYKFRIVSGIIVPDNAQEYRECVNAAKEGK